MNHKFFGYKCSLCDAQYGPDELIYTCRNDGGNVDIVYDYSALQRDLKPEAVTGSLVESLWRYLPLLPVHEPQGAGTPLYAAGWTPTFAPPALRNQHGLPSLWVKDESGNPTASFKDRASAVVIARAQELGVEVVVTASTGNAGAALAGMAAAVGQKVVIFAPANAPRAKIAQLLVFGAQVLLVDGNYDQAFDLSIQAANEFGWYCRNTGYNPFTLEGKKTAAFEIWEAIMYQKSDLSSNLAVFVSVGDGNIISGLHKGFKELKELGWIEDLPRIFGVQAQGSAAIANAFHAGVEQITPVSASTFADSISVDLPRDGVRAVRAASQTNGAYLTVGDDEILSAISELGQVGIFSEPAGATAYAGMLNAVDQGLLNREDAILVINTGSGLKDIEAAMKAVNPAPIIEPTLSAVENHLKGI